MLNPFTIQHEERSDLAHATLRLWQTQPMEQPSSSATYEVQAFGCLLAMPLACDRFTHVSANCVDFVGRDHRRLLNEMPAEVLGSELVHSIRNVVGRSSASVRVQHAGTTTVDIGEVDVAVHRAGDVVVVELLPTSEDNSAEVLSRLTWMSNAEYGRGLAEMFSACVRHLHTISGVDRVAMFRAWPDGSGEVAAETDQGRSVSLLGRRFRVDAQEPVWHRPVVMQDSRAVPTTVMAAAGSLPLDLDLATLRMMPSSWMAFLQEHDIATAALIPIVVDSMTIGFFAFESSAPRQLGMAELRGLELAARFLTSRIARALHQQTLAMRDRAIPAASALLAAHKSANAAAIQQVLAEIRRILGASGAAWIVRDSVILEGRCPAATDLDVTRQQLQMVSNGIFVHHVADGGFPVDAPSGVGKAADGKGGNEPRIRAVMSIACGPDASAEVLLFRDQHAGPGDGDGWRWQHHDVAAARGLQQILAQAWDNSLDIVVQELNHRVRNILALVQSVASQSRSAHSESEDFERLEARIHSLATAHNLLTAGDSRMSLWEMVRREAEPHGLARIELVGPRDVGLVSSAAPLVTLVVHELLSNAAKHGSLSVDSGTVSITWRNDADGCHIDFSEFGGPPTDAPTTRGFGINLIENALEYDLDGRASVRFGPSGVRANMFLPAAVVTSMDEPAPPEGRAEVEDASHMDSVLSGKSVLVLEDDFLVAMQSKKQVQQLGAATVATVNSNAAAIDLLDKQEIHFALVDINLGDEPSTSTVRRLGDLGVPFVFVTGYDTGPSRMIEGVEAPLIRKPVRLDDLRELVREMDVHSG